MWDALVTLWCSCHIARPPERRSGSLQEDHFQYPIRSDTWHGSTVPSNTPQSYTQTNMTSRYRSMSFQ